MNIFVTGASGFIGRAFIKELMPKLSPKDKVFLFVREEIEEKNFSDSKIILVKGSLESIEVCQKTILDCEYVFHIAGNPVYGNRFDYDSENFLPTKKIVDILKKSKKIIDFIFISSIGAVDRAKRDLCKLPMNNLSIPSPRSKYGLSKLKAEEYIKKSNIPFTIIRPTWVYGKNMRQKSHINMFVSMAYKKSLFASIDYPGKVSLIHVNDLAKAFSNCIGNQKVIGKTYFAESEAISIGGIFKIIRKKIFQKEFRQIPIPPAGWIIRRIHQFMPLQINNLLIDYLYAKDDSFKNDLLSNKKTSNNVKTIKIDNIKTIKFEDGIDDVISTNNLINGYWIITGANSGIGLCLARKLFERKKNLILIDKNTDVLTREFKNSAKSSDSVIIKADLSDKAEISRIVEKINNYQIYCLINNAGIGYRKSFSSITEEEIEKIIAVNIESHLRITKYLLRKLKKEGSVIVNIASSIAYNPLPNMLMYSSTKAFILNWSESLTYELGETNNVITISPGGTDTNFQKNSGVKKEDKGKGLLRPEYVADQIISAVDKNKNIVIIGLKTKLLLIFSKFLPRRLNIIFWGKLFEKMR